MEPLLEGLLRSLGGSEANFLEVYFGRNPWGYFFHTKATSKKSRPPSGNFRQNPPETPRSPSRSFSRREAGWKIVSKRDRIEVLLSEGPKGGRRKGGRGRKLSHFSFCCAFRCCVVYSPCFPVWGEEKVMTIYDAGPLAAGPLCGLLILWK